eukprot:3245118-Pleurochrysis_carterae.AAC.1
MRRGRPASKAWAVDRGPARTAREGIRALGVRPERRRRTLRTQFATLMAHAAQCERRGGANTRVGKA